MFGQWLDANGVKIGTEFQLNSTPIGDQTNPDVAIDEAGRAIVTWVSTGQTGGSGADIVYVTLATIGSTTPSAEQLANSSITGDQLAPRVAASAHDANPANNQFVIAWQGPGADDVDLFALRLDSLGVPVGSDFVVNSIASKDQILPDLAMDTAGNVAFVWQSEGQTAAAPTSTLAVCRALERYLEPTNSLTPRRHGRSALQSVAMDAVGNYIVTWQSQHQDGYSWGIYRQGFDATGARGGEEVIVNHHQLLERYLAAVSRIGYPLDSPRRHRSGDRPTHHVQSRPGRRGRRAGTTLCRTQTLFTSAAGSLYNEGDYPATLCRACSMSRGTSRASSRPSYLRQLSPQLYQHEAQRVCRTVDEAVQLAE